MSKKNSEKNFNLDLFLIVLAGLLLPVPVILTGNQFSSSKILKFKFVAVFDRWSNGGELF
jgi:hypothetical protein